MPLTLVAGGLELGAAKLVSAMARIALRKLSISPSTAVFRNTADHVVRVHEGAERKDGTQMPARPFAIAAVEEFNAIGSFGANYRGDIGEAFQAMAGELHGAILNAIEDRRWEWDRPTRRRNGQTVGTPRDIVDQGTLRDRQQLPAFSGSIEVG